MHEADWNGHVCDPPLRAWDRLKKALISDSEAYDRLNGDVYSRAFGELVALLVVGYNYGGN